MSGSGARCAFDVGANEDFIATVVFSHLSARVAVDVPSADGLIVADAVQLVERVPSHACHELLVHVARGRHVETHGAPADCAAVGCASAGAVYRRGYYH